MRKKKLKLKVKVFTLTHVYLNAEDWEKTKTLAEKKNLSGADLVRQWMREGLERSKK